MRQLTEVRAKKLELKPPCGLPSSYYKSFFEQIPSHVRIMHFTGSSLVEVRKPNYNAFATDYVSLGQEKMIRFPKTKQAVCGISISDKVVVGCEDGAVILYRYDKESNSLTELATRTDLHQGRINQITQAQENVIIASSDGKVSVCHVTDTELFATVISSFTEPIYMVQYIDPLKNTYLAAGKRTVYVTVDGIIVKQHSYDSDVTGLSYSPMFGYDIATRYKYYHGPGSLQLAEIDKLECKDHLETPNTSISPDGSLRVTTTKGELKLYDIEKCTLLYSVAGVYAEGPNLLVFCPVDYWITVSTGHEIWTLVGDLQLKQVIKKFAPEISEADMRQGNFPTIRALWYEAQSLALFALFSDNTLRWWKIVFGPKSYIETEKKRVEELNAQTPAADPNPNPNPNGVADPAVPPENPAN